MKLFVLAALSLFSTQALAIEFITEAQVQAALAAEKVIEINKYSITESAVAQNEKCLSATDSRSARAYVVKKDGRSLLVMTPSGLRDLEVCGVL